ncbi:N-formylglutamate amidohydrolase [Aliiroseovarius sp. KMU-50]|uniref:N-formylglutamate amidohydrolase n=2 Tax=Aliiroseovarius salicola TaxID=3009082 RepID=A0ABT4VWR8_9RHOB|nr:N-formylglutamate amidohydrolase [Aliiroseovarius sp. KMU-50]MDA5092696.1 N-formylglutamate amidohydrolase [Aliiroseovarius sp. KMU-50]
MPEERQTSVVFASPHSGRCYEPAFLQKSILDAHLIRSSEDAFVDQLFNAAPLHGAPLLAAQMPRAYVDLNRGAEELDPALINGVRGGALNARVSSGLGVIPRVVAGARAIYNGKISLSEAEQRLTNIWFPYHKQLQALLNQSRETFGRAVLVDCHSMPHEAVRGVTRNGLRPEIVLGDRHGASASQEIVEHIAEVFEKAGFVVARNAPFAGAYITQHYGRPIRNQHVVQVEIDRSIYMNEAQIRPNNQFHDVRDRISQVVQQICQIDQGRDRLAAE